MTDLNTASISDKGFHMQKRKFFLHECRYPEGNSFHIISITPYFFSINLNKDTCRLNRYDSPDSANDMSLTISIAW